MNRTSGDAHSGRGNIAAGNRGVRDEISGAIRDVARLANVFGGGTTR